MLVRYGCVRLVVIQAVSRARIPLPLGRGMSNSVHRYNEIVQCIFDSEEEAQKVLDYINEFTIQETTEMNKEFITKDSGQRQEFSNGFVRDIDDNKVRYDLIPLNMLKRLAEKYTQGAEKYGDSNRQLARGKKAILRFRQSAYRHFIQWMNNELDEDHAMGTIFNIFAYEYHKQRIKNNNASECEDSFRYKEEFKDLIKQLDAEETI